MISLLKITSLFQNLLQLFIPQKCLSCLQFSPASCCKACINDLSFKLTSLEKESYTHFAVCSYEGPIKDLLHSVKFDNNKTLAKMLSEKIKDCTLSTLSKNIEFAISVPLHTKKLKHRGYNQVDLLFSDLCEKEKIPMISPITRVKHTEALFGLTKEERQQTLKEAFSFDSLLDLRGKSVLLLDDIYTSGATVGEIRRLLLANGVGEVVVLTLCWVVENKSV